MKIRVIVQNEETEEKQVCLLVSAFHGSHRKALLNDILKQEYYCPYHGDMYGYKNVKMIWDNWKIIKRQMDRQGYYHFYNGKIFPCNEKEQKFKSINL